MRISDWSSDVCSSDLGARPGAPPRALFHRAPARSHGESSARLAGDHQAIARARAQRAGRARADRIAPRRARSPPAAATVDRGGREAGNRIVRGDPHEPVGRSEEHTSELQSLMRISYAVLCLKKNTKIIALLSRPMYNRLIH